MQVFLRFQVQSQEIVLIFIKLSNSIKLCISGKMVPALKHSFYMVIICTMFLCNLFWAPTTIIHYDEMVNNITPSVYYKTSDINKLWSFFIAFVSPEHEQRTHKNMSQYLGIRWTGVMRRAFSFNPPNSGNSSCRRLSWENSGHFCSHSLVTDTQRQALKRMHNDVFLLLVLLIGTYSLIM